MGQKKLIRFEAIKSFHNVLEYPTNIQGKWNEFFNNHHPITLELACGKGEYTVGLGRLYAERNFIGIDIKGNRIWRGATIAINENLNNIAFVRSHIDKITNYFTTNEVAEIWITFPDPQLRLSKAKKRLTHPKFLRLYQQILQPNGIIHLKTDSPNLYQFTKTVIRLFDLELIEDVENIHSQKHIPIELLIETHYEKLDIAKSNKIHYLKFKLNKDLNVEKDVLLNQLLHESTTD